MKVAALAPIVVLGILFAAYCVVDVVRAPSTRYLPKWAWAALCVLSIPLGGVIYLLVGRPER